MTRPNVTSVRENLAPQKNKSGGKKIYDFDALTKPNSSFGVKNRTARQLRTTISNANQKYHPKKFYAIDVDSKNDPDGANVRVVREI